MRRIRFALLASACWIDLACTAAITDPALPVDPEPDIVVAEAPEIPATDSTADEVVPPADPTAPDLPLTKCDSGMTPQQIAQVDDPTDPGSGRIVTKKKDGTWIGLPLSHTGFDVTIVGTVAETTVTQRFDNPLKSPIEAVYTFPLPHDAAVDDYWIRVGDRAVHGEIKRREEAQDIYRRAKEEGHTAGLLEQERPNVFTQSLANLPPGTSIEVTIHIVQPLRPDAGTYELALPTVVGPRYIPGTPTGTAPSGAGMAADTDAVADASRITPPVLPPGLRGCGDLSIDVTLETGAKLRGLKSVAHHVGIEHRGAVTRVALDEQYARLNRDFILRWRTAGPEPTATLIADPEDAQGGWFTLTINPPADESAEVHGQEFVFLVDASGSMAGEPMDLSKKTIQRFLDGLTPADAFSIIRFSEAASGLGETLLPATKKNIQLGREYVDALHGTGGTEMTEGIRAAFAMPRDPDRTRFVVLLTDGYIGNEQEIFDLVSHDIGDARMFGLGIGSSVNRFLLDGVAEMGHGTVAYVDLAEPTDPVVDRLYAKLRHPALTDLELDWGGLRVLDVTPATLPDLFTGEPVVVFGRYHGDLAGKVAVRGHRGTETLEVPVDLARASTADVPGLASMWARATIEQLVRDPSLARAPQPILNKREQEVIDLSLKYRVLTDYTAFVAVDTANRVDGRESGKTVVQGVELVTGMAHESVWGHVAAPLDAGASGFGAGGGSGSGYGSGSGAGFGGRGKRIPRVRSARAMVRGSMDRRIIQRIVRAHINEVRGCYNDALSRDPEAEGRVSIRFVIDGTGHVTVATVDDDEIGDPELGRCIAGKARKWRFPVSAGASPAVVNYPFVLRLPADDPERSPRAKRKR